MKNEKNLTKVQKPHDAVFAMATVDEKRITAVQQACREALDAVDNATQKCLKAGAVLNEWKNDTEHGQFLQSLAQVVPGISADTAQRWMRAAANVAKALPPAPDADGVIDVETVSVAAILSAPEAELSQEAREWKQLWMDFTADKTIKECLSAVVVDGDDAHRVDRAINGKTKGGAGGDRKDFPMFVARGLSKLDTHLSHWDTMTQLQRTEVLNVLVAAIAGDPTALRRTVSEEESGVRTKVGGADFKFGGWPDEVCRLTMEALKARLKK